MNKPSSSAPPWRGVALVIAGVSFIELMDGTIIATALPHIGKSFGLNAVDLNIGMTAYILAMAVFIPLSGWIADRFGARTVFTTALLIFTAASVGCAASENLWSFTASRVLQGVGGALSVPVGRLIVLRITDKKDLLTAVAYLMWPALAAPILAPPLGGFITEHASWRWIFLINVPLALIAGVFAWLVIPNTRPQGRRKFDVPGFFYVAISCSSLICGLERIGLSGANVVLSALLLGLSLISGWAAVAHFRRCAAPLIDLSAFSIPTFAVTMFNGSLSWIALAAAPFLLPLMFQVAFGMDAYASGLLVLALFAGNLGIKPLTSAVLRAFGFRRVLVINGVLVAITLAVCALFTRNTPAALIVPALFIGGASRSMQFTGLHTLLFADVPPPQINGANTLWSMVGQLNMAMGIALAALALRLSVLWRGAAEVGGADFQTAFIAVAGVALLAVVGYSRLDVHAGQDVSRNESARGPGSFRGG